MSWTTSSTGFASTGGHVVYHQTGAHTGLEVRHAPERSMETHKVVINAGGDSGRGVFSWPSSRHGEEKAYLGCRHGENHYGPPPSHELRALIESHGTDHAWMPLLDKLAEEYPEHFDGPVRQHTAARA